VHGAQAQQQLLLLLPRQLLLQLLLLLVAVPSQGQGWLQTVCLLQLWVRWVHI
jgi:hypothetical protein